MLSRLHEHMGWADANARDALRAMPAGSPHRAVYVAFVRGTPAATRR